MSWLVLGINVYKSYSSVKYVVSFFLKKPLRRGQGVPAVHLRRRDLTQFIGNLSPKKLTAAQFIRRKTGKET
jgi:hypothetical protein